MKELLNLTYIWDHLKNTDKPIILYGMGNGADKIIDYAYKQDIVVNGVFASDNFAKYKQFHNMTVKKLSDIENEFDDFIVLVSFGTQLPEVINNIINISRKYEIYAPDMPVYGDLIFDREYFINNYSEFLYIYKNSL